MENQQEIEHLAAIKQMRDMMERSSKFLSLSGLAGILVGALAILGVLLAYWILKMPFTSWNYLQFIVKDDSYFKIEQIQYLMLDAIMVLIIASLIGTLFAIRNAKRKSLPIWNATTKRMVYNMLIPLLTGMFLIIVLLLNSQVQLILPIMLIFYGLALFNASKYAIDEMSILGLIEIILGIIGSFWVEAGLILWLMGFGILHIIYGTVIYFKYEK